MADLALMKSCRARAGRFAIRSLYRGHVNSEADSVACLLAIRKRWRWFVGKLAAAKWPPAAKSQLHAKYLAHCPVFGLILPETGRAPKSRACLRPLYCPFCYAREYAVAAFDRLAPLLPAPPGEELVLCGTEREYAIDPDLYRTWPDVYRAAAAVIGGPDRRLEVDAAKPLGAVVFHRVRLRVFFNPVLERDVVVGLVVVRTALMVCRKARRLTVPGGVQLSLTDAPGQRELAGEIGRLFRYPNDWYDAPVGAVSALGKYLAKARVFAAYGGCRRAKGEKAVVPEVEGAGDEETEQS